MKTFEIKSETFSGPIYVLLNLVEKYKLSISEISLAKIADDYISFIKEHSKSLNDITHFLNVASTLILIKSKSLLPQLKFTDQEEAEIKNLEIRLKLLKIFQESSKEIESAYNKKQTIFFAKPKKQEIVFRPDTQVHQLTIQAMILEIIKQVPVPEKLNEKKIGKIIKIEKVLERLEKNIANRENKSFFSFLRKEMNKLKKEEQKQYTVVGFLAMLELVRAGTVQVSQVKHGDDINIEYNHGK